MTAPRTTLAHLQSMRRRIDDPKRWTVAALARDALAVPCMADDPRAESWCLMGALYCELTPYRTQLDRACAQLALARALGDALATLDGVCERRSLSLFSDREGHASVVRLLDFAIDLERERGAR